jgi:hypothetical protein
MIAFENVATFADVHDFLSETVLNVVHEIPVEFVDVLFVGCSKGLFQVVSPNLNLSRVLGETLNFSLTATF